MASTLFFNGQLLVTPATVSQIDDSAMNPTNDTSGNDLALIGVSAGGQPNSVLSFGSAAQAAGTLISGDLCTAVQKAFAPSDDTNAPATVYAIRVGTATQASLMLQDANGNPAVLLQSTDYGLQTNQIKVKIETGTDTGKRITVQSGTSYYTADDVGQQAFTVQYTGAAATAVLTITGTTITIDAPTGTALATVDLNTYSTYGQVVDYLNTIAGLAAAMVGTNEDLVALNGLDAVTGQDIKTAAVTVTADLEAAVTWFNGAGEGFVNATRQAGSFGALANTPFTYLAGGSTPPVLTQDWANAFTTLQGVDVQWLVPLSPAPAVWAMADAHCSYMSTTGRKERRCFVGPDVGTDLATVLTLPKALNSDRTALCWPGYYDYDVNGNLTLYPPYFTAVCVAAAFAGSNPGTAMTNKTLTLRGLEVSPRDPTDTDPLIQAGVLCVENTAAGYKVVRSVTTWLADNNYYRCEVSVGRAADYTARSVRDALDVLRGQKATPLILARAIAITETTLRLLAQPEPAGLAVLAGDATSPAYKGITAQITGDVLSVSFQCSPVLPVNFIPITISLVPYSGTASA